MKKKKIVSCLLAASMAVAPLAGMPLAASAETEKSEGKTISELLAEAGSSADENTADSADTLDELYANFSSGFNEDGTVDSSVYDYTEEQDNADAADLPNTFDLRHVGGTAAYNAEKKKNEITGGKSYVTPVKLQNPWGTCWAFGISAASESSILYELGLGTDTVDNNNIDLSEHHLAWFAKNHIPAKGEEGYGTNYVNNQDGEGMYYDAGKISSSMEGGAPYFGTSVFATGSGAVTEEFAPYKGSSEEVMVRRNTDADKTKYPDRYLYYDSVDAWNAETDENLKANYTLLSYSSQDDWSLDESKRFSQSYVLEESNVLPNAAGVKDKDTGVISLNQDGINAVKAALAGGKAVEVAFYADSSDPNAENSLNTARYINSNYAHYTWDTTSANHSVCIVGWDDDYDKSNFGQAEVCVHDEYGRSVYKLKDSGQTLEYSQDGKTLYYTDSEGVKHEYSLTADADKLETVKEDGTSISVPAGNGAWIVKNSWGANTNEFPNKNTWGVDGSGYFYISYYDTSIQMLETYDFITTEEEKKEQQDYTIIDEYDYMTASSAGSSKSYKPVLMTNVFTAEENMVIEAVSCQTTVPDTTVQIGIVLLNADQDAPSAEDSFTALNQPVTYTYGGYHRQVLETPLFVTAGQKYAVIAMEQYKVDGDDQTYFAICSNSSYGENAAELLGISTYSVGIINQGESFILTPAYNSDKVITTDYYDFVSNMQDFNLTPYYFQYDNFSIKAYARPATDKDMAEAFATRLYEKCLGRTPDQAGLEYWTNALVDQAKSYADVAYGFVFSAELTNKDLGNQKFAEMLYNTLMDREPDTAGLNYWVDKMNNGTSRQEVFNGFVNSTEFENLYKKYTTV